MGCCCCLQSSSSSSRPQQIQMGDLKVWPALDEAGCGSRQQAGCATWWSRAGICLFVKCCAAGRPGSVCIQVATR
jgi:hypothetical protein